MPDLDAFLLHARVDADVLAMQPDYRVALVAASGIEPGPSDAASDALLREAETSARDALSTHGVEELPHVAAWREAYRAFGAKPQRTRNSLEALLRRVDAGLPRVNRLTDIYNAVSVRHLLPLGGEDLDGYAGSPALVRASGDEVFDPTVHGEIVTEHPELGEVIWRDEVGVTCRRWNWRQGYRTRLTDDTTSAIFILDALGPMPDSALIAAADDLIGHLSSLGASVHIAQRIIGADTRGAR
ncbi:hypothetical protein MT344_08165 [Clavibacter michiganensis subsp. phaseoli]|uniref:B3/B4 domain-containing protein n=1 Tax=Clavibacter phaseoli TaxID=1734031 RepID=UPI001FB49426|nr:phenylalanine--tRNA ligase beta subunit-related protein [Clavibacter phaseoli]MCJ1711151.1 hypothetical protein [Clavibacter phaseoli]